MNLVIKLSYKTKFEENYSITIDKSLFAQNLSALCRVPRSPRPPAAIC